jgi:hypothetical protein
MQDKVRTYPELIAEKEEAAELWRMQYERLLKHVDYYKRMWEAQHAEASRWHDVVICLEGQIADQDEEIARLKKLNIVQQGTVEFLNEQLYALEARYGTREWKTVH